MQQRCCLLPRHAITAVYLAAAGALTVKVYCCEARRKLLLTGCVIVDTSPSPQRCYYAIRVSHAARWQLSMRQVNHPTRGSGGGKRRDKSARNAGRALTCATADRRRDGRYAEAVAASRGVTLLRARALPGERDGEGGREENTMMTRCRDTRALMFVNALRCCDRWQNR